MSRYIDADMLEKDGWSMVRIRQASPTEMIYETKKPTDFPAADVAEVRHGRWEDVEPAPYNLFYATCSVCGERQTITSALCTSRKGERPFTRWTRWKNEQHIETLSVLRWGSGNICNKAYSKWERLYAEMQKKGLCRAVNEEVRL